MKLYCSQLPHASSCKYFAGNKMAIFIFIIIMLLFYKKKSFQLYSFFAFDHGNARRKSFLSLPLYMKSICTILRTSHDIRKTSRFLFDCCRGTNKENVGIQRNLYIPLHTYHIALRLPVFPIHCILHKNKSQRVRWRLLLLSHFGNDILFGSEQGLNMRMHLNLKILKRVGKKIGREWKIKCSCIKKSTAVSPALEKVYGGAHRTATIFFVIPLFPI